MERLHFIRSSNYGTKPEHTGIMNSAVRSSLFFMVVFLLGLFSCELTDDEFQDPRDAFVGEWNCTEYENGQPQISYPVYIEKDTSNSSWVNLFNFGYIGSSEKPPYGVVSGDYITIPSQKVCFDESVTVDGNGQLVSDNEMNWEYNLEIGGDSYHYSAVFTKQ